MSMNYDNTNRTGGSPTDDEGLLFAPVPAWERGKKRRGLGGLGSAKKTSTTTAAEPRAFDTTDATTYRDERVTAAPLDTRTGFGPSDTSAADDGIASPIIRTRTATTRKAKSGAPGAAVALGVLALAGVGATGWYLSQDNDDSVAELTPGVTDTSATALATAPTTMPAPVATETRTTEVAAAEPARTTTVTRRTETRTASAARTRPATAASATESGINASGTATLPAGPQPYSTLQGNTAGTTTTTPAPTVTPPVTEQPATPATETPAPMPTTPPVSADPAPQPVNPATPETPTETPVPDPTA